MKICLYAFSFCMHIRVSRLNRTPQVDSRDHMDITSKILQKTNNSHYSYSMVYSALISHQTFCPFSSFDLFISLSISSIVLRSRFTVFNLCICVLSTAPFNWSKPTFTGIPFIDFFDTALPEGAARKCAAGRVDHGSQWMSLRLDFHDKVGLHAGCILSRAVFISCT